MGEIDKAALEPELYFRITLEVLLSSACEPKIKGRYALHAADVHRPKRVAPGCFDWLTVARRTTG